MGIERQIPRVNARRVAATREALALLRLVAESERAVGAEDHVDHDELFDELERTLDGLGQALTSSPG